MRILCTLLAALCLGALAALPAGAAAAPAAPASNLQFGDPFYSSNPDVLPFQTKVLTPSADNITEVTNPACIAPSGSAVAGRLVPDSSMARLRTVIREGELILAGEGLADRYDDDGARAYADFITAVQQGKYRDANRVRSGDQFDLNGDQDGAPDPFVNALVNPNAQAVNEARARIPSSCNFDASQDVKDPDFGFGSIFGDPGGFMLDLLLWVGAKPGAVAYNWLAPMTFQYSFFTPHTERGETIFDITGSDQQIVRQYGFNPSLKTDAAAAAEKGVWLVLAVWLRAILSGFYILALVAAGFLYMVRGPVRGKINALKMAPKILLSVILTLAIPTLIGMAITVSNLITSELFRSDPTCVERLPGAGNCELVRQVNGVLQQGNYDLSQISNNIEAGVFQLLAVNSSALFYAFFAAVAIIRQLALIVAVVLAPVACFTIIFERHQEWFTRWAKAVIAICLIPVGMALVLRVGLALNPTAGLLTSAPPTGSASEAIGMPQRLLALVVMLCTFYFMAKVPRMLKGWVTGQQGTSLGVQALRGLGRGLGASPVAGLALAGRGAERAASAGDFTNQTVGRLVPGGSHEHRALPSASLRARGLRKISGAQGLGETPSGVVEAIVARAIPATTASSAPASGAPEGDRRTLSQREYQRMIADRSAAERTARDAGAPAPPQEWVPARDDQGNFWAARNPRYEAEAARWRAAAGAGEGVQEGGPSEPLGAQPEVGGPGPRMEAPADLAGPAGAPAGAANLPGSIVSASGGERADQGAPGATPHVGGSRVVGGIAPVEDAFTGAPADAGLVGAQAPASRPHLSGARPSVEPVAPEDIEGLFDPIEAPDVDVTSGIERSLEQSSANAADGWESRRDGLLSAWRENFASLGERQRDAIRAEFADARASEREAFGDFVHQLRLEDLEDDDPALMMAWLDMRRDRIAAAEQIVTDAG